MSSSGPKIIELHDDAEIQLAESERIIKDSEKMVEVVGANAEKQRKEAGKMAQMQFGGGMSFVNGGIKIGGTFINIKKCNNIQVGNNNVMYVNDTSSRDKSSDVTFGKNSRKVHRDIEVDVGSLPVMSSTRVADHKDFMHISHKLGNQWKRLFRNLDVDDDMIDEMQRRYLNDGVKEIIIQCLQHWKEEHGSNAHIQILAQALSSIGHNDIVRELRD